MGDKSIGMVIIPERATAINARASVNSLITVVTLPASLTYIANSAFSGTAL